MSADNAATVDTIIQEEASGWQKQDTIWALSLYGTAIGAGILFLPIDAGLSGIWPMLMTALLAFPMTYFAHQALCRFVLSGSSANDNITAVVDEHFGSLAGKCITLLYFFAIYPLLLMYSVAITNTSISFLTHQMGITPPARAWVAIVLIMGLMGIVQFGQEIIVKTMSTLVYPFVTIIILLSLYLIPHWNGAIFHANHATNGGHSLLMTLWLVIPVIVFSFNHSPIISSFAVKQKQRYGNQADQKSSSILKYSHLLMATTVILFTFSCVFSLSPDDLALAKQQNISILSYLANHFHTPLLAYIAPPIAFLAIAKSFLGHYLGAKEGLHGLLEKSLPSLAKPTNKKTLQRIIELFILLSCWIVATINPSILGMIETLGGPVIAMILFLMPMYAIARVPALRKYKGKISNLFITIMGLITISAILYGLSMKG